jgi:ectoine hydroxylase-related dioxygenase (phytanoyl-CoA dioxygenase family)
MKSSSDSLVVWVPLVDVTKDLGPVILYPGTHTLGDISDSTSGGFATIENYDLSKYNQIQPEVNAGDVVIFSTFLVHKSGDIINDEIRWSCHLRYTNMMDKDFIGRDFPNPYVYKPEIQK